MMESPVVSVAHRVVTRTAALRNLPQRQPLKDHLFDNTLLDFRKSCQRFLNDLLQFLSGDPRSRSCACFPSHGFFKVRPVVELPQEEIVPPVDAPVISVL